MSEDTTQRLPDDGVRLILARLDSMNSRFDSMDARLDSMDARLTALEDKVDRRLQETRPIWEQVLTRLTAVEERLTNVEGELVKLGTRVKNVEDEVFMLRRKFDVWTGDLTLLQQRYEDLKERFDEFKSERPK
jgi:predicted nuclease with TOPRIM domain